MVGPLLRVLCVSFILEELAMVPSSLLARRMQFKLILYIQIGMLLVRAGTAIILALNGMGVWSLVGGSLAGWLVPVSYTHLDVYKRQENILVAYSMRSRGARYTWLTVFCNRTYPQRITL